jgi:hypothetical protein
MWRFLSGKGTVIIAMLSLTVVAVFFAVLIWILR